MKNCKKTITALALSAALISAAGIMSQKAITANAESAIPEIGSHMLEQTDAMGRTVSVPVEFDGEKYILADYTRNIFVYNGKQAPSLTDVVLNTASYQMFTSEDGVFADRVAVSLYYNVITAYDFSCKENIGVDYKGLNGKNDNIPGNWKQNGEIPLHVFVHFNADNFQFNAAFTSQNNQGYMIVGDGDPYDLRGDMYRQARALDVIAHEYQHGITHFMIKDFATGGEFGAIDEGISDVFGMLIENKDPFSDDGFWTVGEDCSVSGRAMRTIKDPDGYYFKSSALDKWDCGHAPGRHTAWCDNGYVHNNSTIVSHLVYTAWEISPHCFTREKIARLWFGALTHLNGNANFQSLRHALMQSAEEQDFDTETINALKYSFYVNGYSDTVMFKVTFQDEDGNVLYTAAVSRGESLQIPDPVKESTEQYDYVFQGWDRDLSFILEDMTATAYFNEVLRNYTVRFEYEDGTLIQELVLPYGSDIEAPIVKPALAGTEEFDYIFEGWRGLSGPVTEDRTVIALFYTQPVEKTPELSNSLPLILGISAGAVALIGVAVAVVLVKKKKSKS